MNKTLIIIAISLLTFNSQAQQRNRADRVGGYPNGLAITSKNYLYGYKDKTGKEIIPLIYANAMAFSEGLAAVQSKKNGLWGFINTTGEIAIDFKYSSVGQSNYLPYSGFEDGHMVVETYEKGRGHEKGLIDTKGNIVIPFSNRYYAIYNFVNGMAKISINANSSLYGNPEPILKYGFVNKFGIETVQPIYDEVENFSEGLALVMVNTTEKKAYYDNKYGFINTEGKVVIPIEYDEAYSFSEGFACVKKAFKTYFIDQTNKTVLKTNYSISKKGKFNNGLCRVADVNSKKMTIKYGYINKTGKLVIPFEYEDAGSFNSGVTNVKKNGLYGIIDVNGKIIHPHTLSYLDEFHNGIAKYGNKRDVYTPEKEFGLINQDGELITPIIYKGIYDFENGKIWVRNTDHEWICLDRNGNQK